MENNPLVTVNILSHNRKEELRNTLKKVYEQDYKNIEVIVVDNASSDESAEMVRVSFPSVRLIKMEKNIGVSGWNNGIKSALGKYIFLLDDDAYPAIDAIPKAIDLLECNSHIGAVTFNVIDSNSKNNKRTLWLPSDEIVSCEWPIFVGCAAVIREKCKIEIPKDYFLYQHELPVSAYIYANGYKIIYDKSIIAYHFFKDISVHNLQQDKLCFRNNISFIVNYLPLLVLPFYYSQQILFYCSRSIKYRWFSEWFHIITSIKRDDNSTRINYKYFLNLRKLHLFNYSLLLKFRKK